jgi:hypothetical protein
VVELIMAALLHACQYETENQSGLILPCAERDTPAWAYAPSFFHVCALHTGSDPRLLVSRAWPTSRVNPALYFTKICHSLSKNSENALSTFERKILRRIYGPVQDNGQWRVR